MMRMISIIEDVFDITGRGLIVVPGVTLADNLKIRAGDSVLLKRADGTELVTTIMGIELIGRGSRPILYKPLVFRSDLTKEAMPIGTEIWFDDLSD
jgi:hypothetical protein